MSAAEHEEVVAPLFHLVCRDCSHEGLFEDVADADKDREAHIDETGHRVVMAEVRGSGN